MNKKYKSGYYNNFFYKHRVPLSTFDMVMFDYNFVEPLLTQEEAHA